MSDVEIPSSSSGEREWELLDRQAFEAKQAMLSTAREMLDIRIHIQQHPWLAIGAACLAGVATAGILERQPAPSLHSDSATAAKKKAIAPILTKIVGETVKFLAPTLFAPFAAELGRKSFSDRHDSAG